MIKQNIENARRKEHINERTFQPNAISRWGRVYLTKQPQTALFLEHNNITLISPERSEQIASLASMIRPTLVSNHISIFSISLIEYYNKAGIVINQMNNPNHRIYGKYINEIKTDEERALLAMLLIDPELKYYKTFMSGEDKINSLETKYGFISKELLEIERLYDFVTRYRQSGKDEDMIKYMANKLYGIDENIKGR